MAGIVYKPVKNVSVYANYSEALQAGAVASGTDANGNVVSNLGEMFAPTKSRQKEVGVKYDAGTLGMSAALFSITQPSSYVQNGVYGQFGEQRNQGLELSVFGTPMRGVRLLGGLTLIDAELRTTQNGVNQGNDAIGVPDTQLNLGAEWDVPGVAGLTLTGRALYTSSQYADAANTQELPSWTRLDLGARYMTSIANHDVTFRLRVDNATDKSYWASSGGSSGSGYLVLSTPRTFGLSATVAF
jgi:iron complex outermembrane receptor protein